MEAQEVILLDSGQIDLHWEPIAELFRDTPWLFDLYEVSDFYELVKTGEFQLWALNDGVVRALVLTRIQQFPKKKIFEIIGVKGSRLEKFFDQIEDVFEMLAQTTGCQEMRAVVRPGLEKALKRRGARQVAVWLKREVGFRGIQ